jgi:hypothetical protein
MAVGAAKSVTLKFEFPNETTIAALETIDGPLPKSKRMSHWPTFNAGPRR